MKSIKFILAGIILILASLFFMGVCIIDRLSGQIGPELFSLVLLLVGLVVSGWGLLFPDNKFRK